MKRYFLRLAFASLVIFAAQSHAAYSHLFVVGDSLSDNGNAKIGLSANQSTPWKLIPDAPYFPSDTFSNGPVWVDLLAQNLGLPLLPSLAGGTNYAFGGARTGSDISLTYGLNQVGIITSALFNPIGTPSDALYVVGLGGNDVRDAARAIDAPTASGIVNTAIANIETIVTTLANSGATNFLIPNLSDLSLVPEAPMYTQDASALTGQFNTNLAASIANLEQTLMIEITELDVFSAFNAIVDDPGEFGFSDASNPCLEIGGNGVCANPDTFVFWDGIHPTTAIHAQTAALATAAVVPIPATLPLLFSAILGLRFWQRKSLT